MWGIVRGDGVVQGRLGLSHSALPDVDGQDGRAQVAGCFSALVRGSAESVMCQAPLFGEADKSLR